jgi:hypothetical protein
VTGFWAVFSEVPVASATEVIAAGGIGDGRGVAAALTLVAEFSMSSATFQRLTFASGRIACFSKLTGTTASYI